MATIGAAMTAAIAHVGPNMPQDLLRASGRHRGPLPFDIDRPTPTADRWLESKFAPWARFILEAWAAGAYDDLAQVLFSRADDSAQRLYYYLCELQRRGLVGGPEPLILDIAKIPRRSSVVRTASSLRELARRLGVDQAALASSIERTNRERDAAPAIPGDGRRCLLVGTPPPDRRLHDAAARSGFIALGPTLYDSWSELGALVDINTSEPFLALARHVHADPNGPRAFGDPGALLRDGLARSRAEAVILWQIEEDEAQAWHLPAQRAALAASGVPTLVMTRRDWLGRDGAADEIAAFLAGVGR
jgi:hypothetical protein